MKRILLATPLILLSACGTIGNAPAPTLADISAAQVPEVDTQLPQMSQRELVAIYRQALTLQQDAKTRVQVQHRLADIQLLMAEEQQVIGEPSDETFDQAIVTYHTLLDDYPAYELRDEILYQLARAYDLSGQSESSRQTLEQLAATAPVSQHLPEAQFRRAERHFVEGEYAAAEARFADVVIFGAATPFYTRSLYMQGWSRFKQDEYRASIGAFTASLDELLTTDTEIDTLSRGDRELVQDSLRVLALAFNYLEGTETIHTAYRDIGVRHYQHLLYEALGQLYLSQERYRDSAETYRGYAQAHPESSRLHHFKTLEIDAYEAGGFQDLVLAAKKEYVAEFSVDTEYWLRSSDDDQLELRGQLTALIEELGTHYHALAQEEILLKDDATEPPSQQAADYYAQAVDYYRLYLESFPTDTERGRIAFLLAESLFEAHKFEEAIPVYEHVAYFHATGQTAADAAYTGILAYNELIETAPAERDRELRQARIAAEWRFYERFSEDDRSPRVMAHAATDAAALEDYSGALWAAKTLLHRSPAAPNELLVPMWLVSAKSLFATAEFAEAEVAYTSALAMMNSDDERYTDTRESLAAAIYRQGELAASAGQHAAAATHFTRVMDTTPQSPIRTTAQYDAALALMQAGDLEAANQTLVDFRSRFPDHELTAEIPLILVKNYEQLQQWRSAALELDGISQGGERSEESRQALLVAAQYYDDIGDTQTATSRFRTYANQWPQPLTEYLEVTGRLATLYAQAGETEKHFYWLEKIVAAHDQAGDSQTDRSRYLAAQSTSTLADREFERFSQIKLKQPLKDSLTRKRAAMETALAAYSKSNGYAIEDYSTKASFMIGQIYISLSQELHDSERPANLEALALEQYDMMLEEQAYPFEEKAIAVHESNVKRCWDGVYDDWVKQSYASLASLLPARYGKEELRETDALDDIEAAGGKRRWKKLDALMLTAIEQRQHGDFASAEATYMSALSLREDYALTHRNLGILYDLYQGSPDQALHHYGRYQDLAGNNDRRVNGWIADLRRRQPEVAQETL